MAFSPLVAGAGLGFLASTLLTSDSRPKSRAEWETMFKGWTSPSSTTEQQKTDATERAVRHALAVSNDYQLSGIRIIAQGSSVNNTNTKNKSDIDLVVIAENQEWFAPATNSEFPPGFTGGAGTVHDDYPAFRNAVLSRLQNATSGLLMKATNGKKAIKLTPNSESRVECDVLPAFRWKQFRSAVDERNTLNGIIFIDGAGDLVRSFPEQHLANGRNKNTNSNNRYKNVVRVLKKIRNRIEDESFISDDLPSSYQIECLVYNVPDAQLTYGTIYDATHEACKFLHQSLANGPRCNKLVQVHGVYFMFPHWGQTLLGNIPPSDVEQCTNFVNRVAEYIAPTN